MHPKPSVEHVDHAGGLYGLVSRYQVPVYCTARTQLALQQVLDRSCGVCRPVEHEALTTIGTMTILPVPVSHDALDPMAYIVVANGKRAMFATDLGYIGPTSKCFRGISTFCISSPITTSTASG
jgi:phosphoribosyl 1,2-cyclic phosphodiesterase